MHHLAYLLVVSFTIMEHNSLSELYLIKQISKLFLRLERIIVPSNELRESAVGPKLATLLNRVKRGDFFEDCIIEKIDNVKVSKKRQDIEFVPKQLQWNNFEKYLYPILLEETNSTDMPQKLLSEIMDERNAQEETASKYRSKYVVEKLQVNIAFIYLVYCSESLNLIFSSQSRNGEPVISGTWRKRPYPIRQYEPLTDYVITESIKEEEATNILSQLDTTLNGFLGPAYNYDDNMLTEEWMVSFRDGKSTNKKDNTSDSFSSPSISNQASDDEVIRTQIVGLLEVMVGQVQDRVCNSLGVLDVPPVGLGGRLKEAPVWGIDCYTRRMIELAILDNVAHSDGVVTSGVAVTRFIEKRLLPTVNAQDPDRAHNITYSLRSVLEVRCSILNMMRHDDLC